jgi:hypothetical protein
VYGGTLIRVGLDNGDGAGDPRDGVLHLDEVDDSELICSGAIGDAGACAAPSFDSDLGTGDLVGDVAYVGDDVVLSCNDQGTTLDLVYKWTASTSGCVHFNPLVADGFSGTHPFLAVLDACSGEPLHCHQGGADFNVEQGKSYLLVLEPYAAGDPLGYIQISPGCI